MFACTETVGTGIGVVYVYRGGLKSSKTMLNCTHRHTSDSRKTKTSHPPSYDGLQRAFFYGKPNKNARASRSRVLLQHCTSTAATTTLLAVPSSGGSAEHWVPYSLFFKGHCCAFRSGSSVWSIRDTYVRERNNKKKELFCCSTTAVLTSLIVVLDIPSTPSMQIKF